MLGGISCSKRTIEQAAGDICSSISIHFADEAAVSAVTAFCTIDGFLSFYDHLLYNYLYIYFYF